MIFSYLSLLQTPTDTKLMTLASITKTIFIRNHLAPMNRRICELAHGTAGPSWGGALLVGSARSINIDSVNYTSERGGMSVLVKSVIFRENAADNGGAIAFLRASLLQMDEVQFIENKARDGGAVYLTLDGDAYPEVGFDPIHYVNGGGLLFRHNKAQRGGALYSHVRCATGLDLLGISPYNITRMTSDMAANNEDDVFIENSAFLENSAIESGGAWHVDKGRVGCLFCNFSSNSVGRDDGEGGAIALKNEAALHARNVAFVQNSADNGGAVYVKDSLVDVVESDFSANVAEKQGGGMYISVPSSMQFRLGSVGVIEKSTFDGNTAMIGGG